MIYGEHGFFCSGGDLNTIRSLTNDNNIDDDGNNGGSKMIILMQHNLTRLAALPLITMAFVEGMALGGGAELMAACDYRLATNSAKIGFVQVHVGITTVWGGGPRLVQIIGYGKALSMLATGKIISSSEAAEIGFVDHIVEADSILPGSSDNNRQIQEQQRLKILEHSKQFLQPFLSIPREILLPAKLMASEARNSLSQAFQREAYHALKVWGGPIHQKALYRKVNHIKK